MVWLHWCRIPQVSCLVPTLQFRFEHFQPALEEFSHRHLAQYLLHEQSQHGWVLLSSPEVERKLCKKSLDREGRDMSDCPTPQFGLTLGLATGGTISAVSLEPHVESQKPSQALLTSWDTDQLHSWSTKRLVMELQC
jgi:hypothetical protein